MAPTTTTTTKEPTTTTTTTTVEVEQIHFNEFLDTLGLTRAQRLRADKVYAKETDTKTLQEWKSLYEGSKKNKSTEN